MPCPWHRDCILLVCYFEGSLNYPEFIKKEIRCLGLCLSHCHYNHPPTLKSSKSVRVLLRNVTWVSFLLCLGKILAAPHWLHTYCFPMLCTWILRDVEPLLHSCLYKSSKTLPHQEWEDRSFFFLPSFNFTLVYSWFALGLCSSASVFARTFLFICNL